MNGPVNPWPIEVRPYRSEGDSSDIMAAGARIRIMPSTSRDSRQVAALAARIAAVPVYEQVLSLLANSPDEAVSLIAREALEKGGRSY